MILGRWARQSYYAAIFNLSTNILVYAECYIALKSYLQRYRHSFESDPIPRPREEQQTKQENYSNEEGEQIQSKLKEAINIAHNRINDADSKGEKLLKQLVSNERAAKRSSLYKEAINAYRGAFNACSRVREIDPQSFTSSWFRTFYQRNYNALQIKSVYDNVVDNVDDVRYW